MEEFLTLFLSKLQTFIPLSSASQHLKTGHITTFHKFSDLVIGNVHVFFDRLNLGNKYFLHLHRSHVLCTFHCAVELLASQKGINCLFKQVDGFKDITSRFKLLDVE
jgi:hypothetical protein